MKLSKIESAIQSSFIHKMYRRTRKSETEEAEQQFRPVVAEFNQQFRPAIAVIKMPLYIRLAWWFVLLCGGVLVAAIIDSCLSYFTDYTISAGLWLVYRLVYTFWKYIESWVVYVYLNVFERFVVLVWDKLSWLLTKLGNLMGHLWKFITHVFKNLGKSLIGIVHPLWKISVSWLVFIKDLFVAFVSHTAEKLNLI